VPNDELVICNNISQRFVFIEPTNDNMSIEWDCMADNKELSIGWKTLSGSQTRYPDLESLTPLKKAKYILRSRPVKWCTKLL